jgi:hypothetical protein
MNLHEVLDDTVEGRALVSESKILALSSLAGTKSPEVFDSLWDGSTVRFISLPFRRGNSLSVQSHDDTTEWLSSVFNVKVDLGSVVGSSLPSIRFDDRNSRQKR